MPPPPGTHPRPSAPFPTLAAPPSSAGAGRGVLRPALRLAGLLLVLLAAAPIAACAGRGALRLAVLLVFFTAAAPFAAAQVIPPDSVRVAPADTLVADPRAVPEAADTVAVLTDPLAPVVGRPPARASGMNQPVEFTAADSLIIRFDGEGGDVGSLFGNAKVSYGETTLDAHQVDLLFDIDELRASGLVVDTGMVGRPSFQDGNNNFSGNRLAFNLRTERGRVVEARTAMEDGFLRASVVKVGEESTVYAQGGAYTTCECVDDPSYSLRSDKMKIVDQKWIYTGPIQLYLFNIPTPLWLPFGFLPAQEGRRSGPLPPSYGEDERGFYLREWGWYQAINEYMDVQVQFGLWTRGSWEVSPLYRYSKRYRYQGNLALNYVRSRRGERDDPDFSVFNSSSLRWTHNQTIDPSSRFNSNVNLSSQDYLRTVSNRYDDRVRSTIQSSMRYSKNWQNTGRNLSVDVSQQQSLATGEATLTLPQLSFSQGAKKPFQRDSREPGQRERWYELISYTYSGSLNNNYRFNPLPADTLIARGDPEAVDISWYEGLFSPSDFRRATGQAMPFDFRASHRVNSNASFSIERLPVINRTFRLNLSPQFAYTEDWHIRRTRQQYSEDVGRDVTETQPGFMALRQFNTGISANTTFYGLFPVRIGPYSGVRHTVRPTLSFNYRPDFYDDFWGYTDTFVGQDGTVQRYAVVPGVQRGLEKRMGLSVSNVFETKHVSVDTTGERQSRTVQLLIVDFSSSYNAAADSFKLSPVSLSARTRVLDQLDLRMNATFSPYQVTDRDPTGRRLEVSRLLALDDPLRPLRLTNVSVSMNTSLRSDRGQSGGRPVISPRASGADPGFDPDSPFGAADPFGSTFYNTGFADFEIPWSLRMDATYSYSTSLFRRANRQAILNASVDFNLTPNWKVQGRSGYDFIQSDIVLTNVSVMRDFECWQMSFNWVPFGPYASYSFDLHVKSGHLRDLLRIRQPRSDVKGRFGGLR